MSFEEFLRIFEQILNEFIILNEYFDSSAHSKTTDYDFVFMKWVKDMDKRYKNIYLSMHWATSVPLISKNQLLFDAKYRDNFFCEVKYVFLDSYTKGFRERCYNYIDELKTIVNSFDKFNKNFVEKENSSSTEDYEKNFTNWKKEVYSKQRDIAIDSHWLKKSEKIFNNFLSLNIIFKDEFLFELKTKPFIDKESEKFITMDEYLDLI